VEVPALLVLEEEAALGVNDPDPEADEDPEAFVPVDEDFDWVVLLEVDVMTSVEIELDEISLEGLTSPVSVV